MISTWIMWTLLKRRSSPNVLQMPIADGICSSRAHVRSKDRDSLLIELLAGIRDHSQPRGLLRQLHPPEIIRTDDHLHPGRTYLILRSLAQLKLTNDGTRNRSTAADEPHRPKSIKGHHLKTPCAPRCGPPVI